ncbi:Na(+)-translocating NADH-quinone reductase subunit F [Bizionia echini]|uniref:Na(+)-translocating NADH-quinone reductase subunit F n=1 Tax=Bizionia echini TaxID=649333 RepID=UPI0030DB6DA8
MEPSFRFEQAVKKLYQAFHNNTLIPECNKQCAVGNILNNIDAWKHFSDSHGSLQLNYIGLVNENFGRRFQGFKPSELLQIEATFLKACGFQLPLNYRNKQPTNLSDKDVLFKGLSAVVALLCQLDNIPNIMDCSVLFSFKVEDHFVKPV